MADTVKSLSVTKGGLVSIQVGAGYPVTASATKWIALLKEGKSIGQFIERNKDAIVQRMRESAQAKAAEQEANLRALSGDAMDEEATS